MEWRYTQPFFTSALDGCDWSATRPVRFTPGEIAPEYPLNTRLGGLYSRSQRCGKEKNIAFVRNRTPAVQPVTRRSTN
jgi:hypothetical protein